MQTQCTMSKGDRARRLLRLETESWFRGYTIDERDRALLDADNVSFVDYTAGNYVRKLFHMKRGEQFGETDWTVEADDDCKKKVAQAGGAIVGYGPFPDSSIPWVSMTVNTNIKCAKDAGTSWGYLSTHPSNIRIFRGPPNTCPDHPWDAMILRDCHTNSSNFHRIDQIASRRWDILAMKMCEDYDHPWVVVSVKDAGEAARPERDCNDAHECGCIRDPNDGPVGPCGPR
ncbi:hypothetical protein JX266_010388 [Neoarthrinium moseri]|uniref:uncharacterized protein n=1 Tax=Neoarthrinium moseri TaxID=1658444 RepID=UPI001FDE6DA6|nr:uncharacterized protein JN550_012736 [Neoarthrinium moseri]KAI1843391.1 hypothetical protein JX266_010388 [Neoarthrinium moseri]KAI1858371.1 hypothetical protein JN550_012736 [Neoarthrinium moseri]